MIIGVRGNLGNGKTATMCRIALHYHSICTKCGRPIPKWFMHYIPRDDEYESAEKCQCQEPHTTRIHANFWIEGINNFHYVTCLDDINKIYEGYAFFDEMWSWIDSRGSGFSDLNKMVTDILLNSRKRGYHIIFESKLIHMTDRRIRELTDYVLEPQIGINLNGEFTIIMQDMLHPFDTKPYLHDMWVFVGKYEIWGENLREVEGGFQYKLDSVTDYYNTREEIKGLAEGEHTAGIEKGIKIENALITLLKSKYPDCEIHQSTGSRGWDVVLKANGSSAAFDVVSVTQSSTCNKNGERSKSIVVRGKKVKNMLKEAHRSNLKPFWAFNLNGQWYKIPMLESHAIRTSISCKDGELICQ